MGAPALQTPPKDPVLPPALAELLKKRGQQALGRLQGPAARKALQELGEIANDNIRREAIIALDEEISAGTVAGPDEVPGAGEAVMLTEAAVAAYQAKKLADNARRTLELLAILAAIAAQVQVQEDKKKKNDCSGATS